MEKKFNMSCNKFDQFGILFLYNELEEDEKIIFQNHLNECEECQDLISEFREIRTNYKTVPEVEPSRKTILKIAFHVRKQKIVDGFESFQKRLFSKPHLMPVSVSLAVAALIILFFIFPFRSDQNINYKNHLAWNNGVDTEIDSIKTDLEFMIYHQFSIIKQNNLLARFSTDTLSLSDYNPKKIEQDIDLLSWNYKQINF